MIQILLLGLLWLIDTYSDWLFVNLTAAVLVIGPTASWTVAAILNWTSQQAPDIISLRERADDAITLALASTGFAFAGSVVFARALGLNVPGRPIIVLLGYGALLVLVPAIAWLQTWRRDWLPRLRHRKGEEHERAHPPDTQRE